MITLKRTNSDNEDFQKLILELDKDLALRNGETDSFFKQFNKTDHINNVVVAFERDKAVGCGAFKKFDASTVEIKRMFVSSDMRGKGVAVAVLSDLEKWAKESGYEKCVLETGDKMPEAIGLYKKSGYKVIKNYGPYEDIESSICFEKCLKNLHQ